MKCGSWTIMIAERQRIDAFEDPWESARRSNQSILKEISLEYSLEGLRLKLKFQYFGHLMQGTDSPEKTLMLGKIEGRRWRGQQSMRWLDSIIEPMDMGLSRLRQLEMDREVCHAEVHGFTTSVTWLSSWTELNCLLSVPCTSLPHHSVPLGHHKVPGWVPNVI